MQLDSRLALALTALISMSCGSSDDGPSPTPILPTSTSGGPGSTGGLGSSDTGFATNGVDSGGVSDQDDGSAARDCSMLDCGINGVCVVDDERPFCQCNEGYIAENEECVLDTECVRMRAFDCRNNPARGSAIGMLTSIQYCNGDPVTDLTETDLLIEEAQNQEEFEPILQGSESNITFIRQPLVNFVFLLVDISGSIQDEPALLEEVTASTQRFVDALTEQPDEVRFAVFTFDGAIGVREFVRQTNDLQAARMQLDDLADQAPVDPASTDLYGAMIAGIQELDRRQENIDQSSDGGVLTTATLVVLSDGDDEAGRVQQRQVDELLDETSTSVLTVGIGDPEQFADFASLGRAGAFTANDANALEETFVAISRRVEAIRQSVYLVGYCSPKRSGTVTVRASVDRTDATPAECSFVSASFGGGQACDASAFDPQLECADRECGTGVVACGECDPGACCVDGQCFGAGSGQGTCGPGAPCASGLRCNEQGECETALAIDDDCTQGGGCEPGVSYCDETLGVCVAARVADEPCESNDECASQVCTPSIDTCAASQVPMFGECDDDDECEPGTQCTGDVCVPQKAAGEACLGIDQNECLSFECVPEGYCLEPSACFVGDFGY